MDKALKEARLFALQICASLQDPINEAWEIRGITGMPDDHAAAMVEVLRRHGHVELVPRDERSPQYARFTSRIIHLLENARSRARRREEYKINQVQSTGLSQQSRRSEH